MKKKITLACSECGSRNYSSDTKKEPGPVRIELKKYCSTCNAHTVHKETK